MNNTKEEDLERLHKLCLAGAITETEFKILKKEIMGEVSDVIDDKVYRSVKIGKQEWMVGNLNVDHFRNGDIIPEAKTKEEWVKAGEEERAAWCYYDNDISKEKKHGKLYNFYAVIDTRGLAPEGWHVPTDAEWTVLTNYLKGEGHNGTDGTALKANSGWGNYYDKSGNGTDNYGWLGLPGGYRGGFGGFNSIGCYGNWWSSSQDNTFRAWYRHLDKYGFPLLRVSYDKDFGFSVRCIKD